MAENKDFLIKKETLKDIADSIRNVDNTLNELSPSQMSEEIRRLTAIIEQDFDANSPNAQSGKAVAEAVNIEKDRAIAAEKTEQENRDMADNKLQSQINTIIAKQETQQDKVITRTLSENTVTETFDAPNAERIIILQDENKTGSIKFDKTNDEVTITSSGKLKLHNVDTPANNLDAANKEYVDTETTNRTNADEALQSQITDNATAISENERNLTQEITDRKAADSALEQKISDITAIQIRNKSEVIESTEADVQTTATNYIQTNYSRAPQNFDGLIITITDKQNDKILYVYSEVSDLWINSGINDIDLSNYYTKDQVYNKDEIDTKVATINQSIIDEIEARKNADTNLQTNIDKKQDKITSGTSLVIKGLAASHISTDVISSNADNRPIVFRKGTGKQPVELTNIADATYERSAVNLKQLTEEKNRAIAAEQANEGLITTETNERKAAINALNKQTMSFDIYSNKDTFETVTVLIPLKETV